MKHRRLTCVSLLGTPAAKRICWPAGVHFLWVYKRFAAVVTSNFACWALLLLPAGAENHTYFTL